MKHCLDCGRLSHGSRCPAHARARHTRMYGARWQRISRIQRARQPSCHYCGSTEDLTADHVIPGSLAGGVVTACRRCNSSKGGAVEITVAYRVPATGPIYGPPLPSLALAQRLAAADHECRNGTIIGLYRCGWSMQEIADRMGMTKGAVHSVLRLAGEPVRRRGRPKKSSTPSGLDTLAPKLSLSVAEPD